MASAPEVAIHGLYGFVRRLQMGSPGGFQRQSGFTRGMTEKTLEEPATLGVTPPIPVLHF